MSLLSSDSHLLPVWTIENSLYRLFPTYSFQFLSCGVCFLLCSLVFSQFLDVFPICWVYHPNLLCYRCLQQFVDFFSLVWFRSGFLKYFSFRFNLLCRGDADLQINTVLQQIGSLQVQAIQPGDFSCHKSFIDLGLLRFERRYVIDVSTWLP